MILNDEVLARTYGGANISYSFVNALTRLISTVLDLGKTVGSIIRRTKDKNYCK